MARRGPRPATSLKRRVGVRRPRKTLVVFCEGSRTEPDYLAALKRERTIRVAASVDIRIEMQGAGSVPLTLVRHAVAARERAQSEEGEVDEFWCVFDVEWPTNHPNLKEALDLARRHEINVAVSNPCFEIWLAWHFDDHTGWLDNADARRLRRDHDRSPDKGLEGALYMARRTAAATRASAQARRHLSNGTAFPHDNPSSGMYRLLASAEAVE